MSDLLSFLRLSVLFLKLIVQSSLAYVEMRLLITLLLWNFDMTIVPESRDWKTQEVYLLWEKPALMVRLKPRADGL